MANFKSKQSTTFMAYVREFVVLALIVFIIRTFGFGLYQVPTGSMEVTMLVGERFFADKFSYLFTQPKAGDVIAMNDPTYDYSDNKAQRLFQEYVWGPSNWTKRVIGVPGDKVRGVIEDGKPVIYVNDKKLDEPYVNKYPIVGVWKIDEAQLRGMTEREICENWVWKSYDPSMPYDDPQQPFYRILVNRIIRGLDGNPIILYPNTPVKNEHMEAQSLAHEPGKGNQWDGSDEFNVELGPNQYWCMGDNRRGSKDCRVFGPIERRLIHGRILFRLWSIDSDSAWWFVDLFQHPIDFWSRVRWSRFFNRVR